MLKLHDKEDGIWLEVSPNAGPSAMLLIREASQFRPGEALNLSIINGAIKSELAEQLRRPKTPGQIAEEQIREIAEGMKRDPKFDAALAPLNPGYTPSPAGYTRAQQCIAETCDEIKAMLLNKNRKYGNSALEPIGIFSKAPACEQINSRLDDKLSRIKNRKSDEDEDPELDLLGYLILKLVDKKLNPS